jgi:septal ring factor EnvC (AmiA/AmiB activator)
MSAKLKNLWLWLVIIVGVVLVFVFRQKIDDVRLFFLKKRLAQRKNQIDDLDKQAHGVQTALNNSEMSAAEAQDKLSTIEKNKQAIRENVKNIDDDRLADDIAVLLGGK